MGTGTGSDDGLILASSVVIDLMTGYLDQGHVLYIDNFYTSVDLANMLLERNIHLFGTVVNNRAWFPHKKTIPPNQKLEGRTNAQPGVPGLHSLARQKRSKDDVYKTCT